MKKYLIVAAVLFSLSFGSVTNAETGIRKPEIRLKADTTSVVVTDNKPVPVILSWSAKNVDTCTFEKKKLATKGNMKVLVSRTASFTIFCEGANGAVTSEPATVVVNFATEKIANEKSAVKLISPNGGEKYAPGQKVVIQWKTVGLPYNVPTQIDVMDDRIPDWTPDSLFGSVPALDYATLVSSKGDEYVYEYSFIVPQNFNGGLPFQYQNIFGGNHYKIVVNVVTGTFGTPTQKILEDSSDKTFTIGTDSTEQAKTIKVLSPAQGDVLYQGKTYTVSWKPVSAKFNQYQILLGNNLLPGKLRNITTLALSTKDTGKKVSATFAIPKDDANFIAGGINALANRLNIPEDKLRSNLFIVVQAYTTDNSGNLVGTVVEGRSGTFSLLRGTTQSDPYPIPAQTVGVKIYTINNATIIGTPNYPNGTVYASVEEGTSQISMAWLPTGINADACTVSVKNQTTGKTTTRSGRYANGGVQYIGLPDGTVGQIFNVNVSCKVPKSNKIVEDTGYLKVVSSN